MLKKILIGALAAIVVVAVGMSAYNAMAGTSTQAEAQPDLTLVEQASSPTEQAVVTELPPAISSTQAEIQNTPEIPAQLNAQTLQTPNKQAGQQGAGAGRGGGNSNGNGGGNRRQGSNGNGTAGVYAAPSPQNGFTEWLTLHGTISAYASPGFTLLSDDGQAIAAQLGNQSYVNSLGLTLNDGDAVTLVGYWETSGSLAVGQITLDATGQTYFLRDELGRPLWGGGPNR